MVRVARIVSPHRILSLPDCLYLWVEIIRWRSDNCIPWIRFLARLRLSAVVRRTTCLRAGVLNSDDRVRARCFRSLLAAFIAGVSVGDEFNSGLSSGLRKNGVDSRSGISIEGGIGTWPRTFWGLKG